MQQITISETTSTRSPSSRSTVKVSQRSIHEMFTPFPVAYFIGAFATDLAYWRSLNVMWERFSVWLIAAGLVMAGVVVIAAIIDLVGGKQRPAWFPALAYACAVLISLVNVLVHSRDGYTAVVPTGLTLSALVFVILLAATSSGWALTFPHRLGADR